MTNKERDKQAKKSGLTNKNTKRMTAKQEKESKFVIAYKKK